MKIIKQKLVGEISIDRSNKDILYIEDDFQETISIDKQGAKQLIEVLKEFINEPN